MARTTPGTPATIEYRPPAWTTPKRGGPQVRVWQTAPSKFAGECACGWGTALCSSRGGAFDALREHHEGQHELTETVR